MSKKSEPEVEGSRAKMECGGLWTEIIETSGKTLFRDFVNRVSVKGGLDDERGFLGLLPPVDFLAVLAIFQNKKKSEILSHFYHFCCFLKR